MLFRRRRTPLELAVVPDGELRAEALRRGLVVLPTVAAEALARWMARPTERVLELEGLLAVERERNALATKVAFAAAKARHQAVAEASRLSAATALGDLGFSAREVEAWWRAGHGRGPLASENDDE